MAADTHLTHHAHHRLRAELLHKVGGYIVGRMGKSPFQGDGLANPLVFIRASRSPSLVANNKGLRDADSFVARSHTTLHGQCVKERFDG